MPCPDTSTIDRLQLHVFEDGDPPTDFQHPLTASKLVSRHVPPPRPLDIKASNKPLVSNGTFWPPLKAIPLASYYKLHRVPSLAAMPEAESDDVEAVKLPRRESTAEPQEQEPENVVQNRILEQVVRTPGRQPSPQPMHLSVPGSSQHKILHEEGSGYVAPKFEGKELQMDEGELLAGLGICAIDCRGLTVVSL